MMKPSLVFLSIAAPSLFALGCQGPSGSNPFEGEDADVPLLTMDGPKTVNGADPDCTADPVVGTALLELAGHEITAGGLHASGIPMLPSLPSVPASCRHILQDVVECALGEGQSVMDQESGAVYTGSVGLAKEWEREPLGLPQRRWVSACLIQRLNYFGISVPVLLEGAQSTIAIDEEARHDYPFAESTAWGNLFDSDPGGWVCTEEDVWSICPEDLGEPWVDTRVCDGAQNCGITFVGKCSDACTLTAAGHWDCSANYGFTETIRVRMETNTHPPILGPCH